MPPFRKIVCSNCGLEAIKRLETQQYPDLCRKCARPVRERDRARANLEKNRAKAKAWADANPERNRERSRDYRLTNLEICQAKDRIRTRISYAKDPAPRKASNKRWRDANLEKSREVSKAWAAKNHARRLATSVAWRIANPEKVRARDHQRRARVAAALGSYTPEEWYALLKRHQNKCFDCGAKGTSKNKMTVGHMVPLCKGGSNTIGNIRPQCFTCNAKQGAKIHPRAEFSLFERVQI